MSGLRKDDVVQRIHQIVRAKYPACDDILANKDPNDLQLVLIQDGKKYNFALGPANAMGKMSDESLARHIWERKR